MPVRHRRVLNTKKPKPKPKRICQVKELNIKDEIAKLIRNSNIEIPELIAEIKKFDKKDEKDLSYVQKETYWKLNTPHSADEQIEQQIAAKRVKHETKFVKEHKYIKMRYFNDIKSLSDIQNSFLIVFKEEKKAFKLLYDFGYVTEKEVETESSANGVSYETRLFHPGQPYFNDTPDIIKNKTDIDKVIDSITPGNIIYRITNRFQDTKTHLLGVFSMSAKVIRLDFPIGSKTELPKHITKTKFMNKLADVEDNLCFWACIAIADGADAERVKKPAKALFKSYYNKDHKKLMRDLIL